MWLALDTGPGALTILRKLSGFSPMAQPAVMMLHCLDDLDRVQTTRMG